MTFEEWGPAAVKAVDAMQKFPGSQEPRETGFGLAFGGKTIFEYLGERPERAKVFGSAMGNFSRGVSHRVEHLVGGYDWKGLGKGSVVDVSDVLLLSYLMLSFAKIGGEKLHAKKDLLILTDRWLARPHQHRNRRRRA